MGTIKATNIEPIADNGTVTLGGSGDIFTLGSGTKASFLYPAFEAISDSNQTVTDNTYTKVFLQTRPPEDRLQKYYRGRDPRTVQRLNFSLRTARSELV